MGVIIVYVFSVYVFCFGQICCLVWAINVTAGVIQNFTATTTLTGKLKFPLMHDKHGMALLYWLNKGLQSSNLLSKLVQFSTLQAYDMLRGDVINLTFFLPQTEVKTWYLHATLVLDSLKWTFFFSMCLQVNKLHYRSHLLWLVYISNL